MKSSWLPETVRGPAVEASMTPNLKKRDGYRQGNLEAARLIAADPERYPGFMQVWAGKVLGSEPSSVVERLKVRAGLEGRTETNPQQ